MYTHTHKQTKKRQPKKSNKSMELCVCVCVCVCEYCPLRFSFVRPFLLCPEIAMQNTTTAAHLQQLEILRTASPPFSSLFSNSPRPGGPGPPYFASSHPPLRTFMPLNFACPLFNTAFLFIGCVCCVVPCSSSSFVRCEKYLSSSRVGGRLRHSSTHTQTTIITHVYLVFRYCSSFFLHSIHPALSTASLTHHTHTHRHTHRQYPSSSWPSSLQLPCVMSHVEMHMAKV